MAVSLSDKVQFIRQYVKGFDAQNGFDLTWAKTAQRVVDRVGLDGLNPKLADKVFQIEDAYKELRSLTSQPFTFHRSQSDLRKETFNPQFGFETIDPLQMKGYFMAGENTPAQKKVLKHGAYKVQDGLLTKWYISFDPIQAGGKNGLDYLERLINDVVPNNYFKRYMLISSHGYEFGTMFDSLWDLKTATTGIDAMLGRYPANSPKGPALKWMNKLVVYSGDEDFIDVDEALDSFYEYRAFVEKRKEANRKKRQTALRSRRTK